jgi:hypothetical protein
MNANEEKRSKSKRTILDESIKIDEDQYAKAVATSGLSIFLKNKETALYNLRQEQVMNANGRALAHTITKSKWVLTVDEVATDGYLLTIEVLEHDIESKTQGVDNLLNFSKLFNEPIKTIVLKLGLDGALQEVVSQQEIYNRWYELKHTTLKEYLHDNSMRGIFIAGDNDFSDTYPVLKHNLLYHMFFSKVYNKTSNTQEEHDIPFQSKLFQAFNIKVDKGQDIRIENQELVVDTECTNKRFL